LKISVYLRLYDGPAALLLFQQWLWPPQRLSLLHQPVVFFSAAAAAAASASWRLRSAAAACSADANAAWAA
ncbi:hypothetical protein QUH12_28970, partial [Klebsiella pneumoniae]|nr:hypothetical protein [Klebsiella pneumoniae]